MGVKTLYISDLDGTLLNRGAKLSAYAAETLNALAAQGLHFTIATARTYASAGKILSELQLPVPVLLMNGVLIYDAARGDYIQIHRLPPDTVAAVIDTLRTWQVTGFMYELNNGAFMTYHESLEPGPLRDFMAERVARYYKTFRHTGSFSGVSPEHIIYFTLLDTHDRLRPVRDALAGIPGLNRTFYKDTYSEDLWYLELFSDQASKEHGTDFLRQTYGFERVVGFGDNLNDLPMFAACDVKVAVDNAKPEVKAAADCLCGANDEDGVVKWIEANAGLSPDLFCPPRPTGTA